MRSFSLDAKFLFEMIDNEVNVVMKSDKYIVITETRIYQQSHHCIKTHFKIRYPLENLHTYGITNVTETWPHQQ